MAGSLAEAWGYRLTTAADVGSGSCSHDESFPLPVFGCRHHRCVVSPGAARPAQLVFAGERGRPVEDEGMPVLPQWTEFVDDNAIPRDRPGDPGPVCAAAVEDCGGRGACILLISALLS